MKLFFSLVLLACACPFPGAAREPAAGGLPGTISVSDWLKAWQPRAAEVPRPARPEDPPPPAARSVQPQAPAVQPSLPPAQSSPPASASPLSAATPAKDIAMKLGVLAWFRYTWADSAAVNTSAFALKAARFSIAGDLPLSFKYSAVLAFERQPSTSTQNSALYDWTLTYAPKPEFNLTMGQFTVPASAELLTPTAQLDFAARYYAQDRILNPSFNHDQGVMALGKVLGRRLQYYAGLFNGKGANYGENDNEKFLYAGRLAWTAFKGKLAGAESSLVVGGSGMAESTRNDPSALRVSDLGTAAFTRAYRRYVYGGDVAVRVGPAALKGEYISALLDGQRADPRARAYGWYSTFAYKLPGEKVELLARCQVYDPNTAHVTSKDARWTTLGANWFMNGYSTRALLNYTFKTERKSMTPNDELIAQLQLSF